MLEHHSKAIDMYKSGESTKEISESIGVSARQVRHILRKAGVDLSSKRRTDGYKVNEKFFRSWSSDMAYVLGFILTDGNISGNSVSIAQKDADILEDIKRVMGATYPIRRRSNNGNSYIHTLTFNRKSIVEDLRALGITENKSLTVDMPEVPKEYQSDFIRGVIDGDGWVQDRGYVMNITTASKTFADELMCVFKKRGLNSRVVNQSNAYRVWVSGKQDVINLAEWLYEGKPNLYLERKRDRFFVNKKTLAS